MRYVEKAAAQKRGRQRRHEMREGFYGISYAGTEDYGFGIIVLDTNMVVGVDVGGVKYDGRYQFNTRTEEIDAFIKLTVPPGVALVQGVPAQDEEYSFEFNASFPRETSETHLRIETRYGPVNVVLKYLRSFPD